MDEINALNSMKKFDNFLKVLSYYNVDRCQYTDCSQCMFAANLGYLYVQTRFKGVILLLIYRFSADQNLINLIVGEFLLNH